MAGAFALISLAFVALFAGVTWALWSAYQRHTNTTLKVITGILMAITGLLALASSVCGVMVFNA